MTKFYFYKSEILDRVHWIILIQLSLLANRILNVDEQESLPWIQDVRAGPLEV